MAISRYSLIPFLAVVLGLTGCTQPETPVPTLQWKRFSSAPGKFFVFLPGVPRVEKTPLQTKLGTLYTNFYTVIVRQSDYKATYVLSYSNYPAGTAQNVSPEHFLQSIFNAVRPSLGNRLAYKKVMKSNGLPALEYQFTLKSDPTRLVTTRNCLVKDRFYQMMAIVSKDQFNNGDTARFLDSFRLLH